MGNTPLFIVRHAETSHNAERRLTGWVDTPLSTRGERQALAVGRALAVHAPIAAVYTSDLARALASAHKIAEAAGFERAEIRATPDLREHSLGALDGLPLSEVEARYPDAWRMLMAGDTDLEVPGCESDAAVSERVGRALDEALSAHRGGAIVLVSHLLSISRLLRLALEIPASSAARRTFFHSDNAAIHRLIRRGDGSFRIAALNDVAHLVGVD